MPIPIPGLAPFAMHGPPGGLGEVEIEKKCRDPIEPPHCNFVPFVVQKNSRVFRIFRGSNKQPFPFPFQG